MVEREEKQGNFMKCKFGSTLPSPKPISNPVYRRIQKNLKREKLDQPLIQKMIPSLSNFDFPSSQCIKRS
jgi:hypothetical protein